MTSDDWWSTYGTGGAVYVCRLVSVPAVPLGCMNGCIGQRASLTVPGRRGRRGWLHRASATPSLDQPYAGPPIDSASRASALRSGLCCTRRSPIAQDGRTVSAILAENA